MAKRYYWLRLKDDFFERDEIKVLEGMPNGKDYIIFYMKLLLKSISTDGILIFNGCIPFTPVMLSSITNTNVDTVKVAVDTLTQLGLMEQWDDGRLFMVMTQNMIGSEGESAARVRALREKSKEKIKLLQCNNEVTKSNTEIEKDINTEKDTNIDKEIDVDVYISSWNSLGLNKLISLKKSSTRYKELHARIADYGTDKVLEAIKNISKSKFLKGENDKGWTITFDWLVRPNNFIKVLEGNYTDKDKPKKPIPGNKAVSKFNNFEGREYDYDDLEKKLLGWDKDENEELEVENESNS